MSKPLTFVNEDVPVEKIADLMIANKIKRVPVLSGEKLVGIGRKPSGYHTGDCHGEAHCNAYAHLRLVSPPGMALGPVFHSDIAAKAQVDVGTVVAPDLRVVRTQS